MLILFSTFRLYVTPRITRLIRRWATNAAQGRAMALRRVLSRNVWKFLLNVRIHRKRIAITRLVSFLGACKGHQAINVLVSRYLKNIRKVQHVVRQWMACKESRIQALHKLWLSLEKKYILRMLRQRMRKKVLMSRGTEAEILFDELNLNQKTRLELEKQNVQWDYIDSQVVRKLLSW